MTLTEFYNGKYVLITGHTGFMGAWLTHLLKGFGAHVTGYALLPPTSPSLYEIARVGEGMTSVTGDVRDSDHLAAAFSGAQPEIVFHLAAQPLVRDSYQAPAYTYETNVIGTVQVLECIRQSDSVRSFVNVTTDKVYQHFESSRGYVENDPLCGYDPYSNSKSCAELVTACYQNAFFNDGRVAISTARTGSVIGGGDFAKDRILPDYIRAAEKHTPILVRSPRAVSPYQHVLEPLFAYLLIAMRQYETGAIAGGYNIGPNREDIMETGELTTFFCEAWGNDASWLARPDDGPCEGSTVRLDCTKIRDALGWQPVWNIRTAIQKTIEWEKAYRNGLDIRTVMDQQATEYQKSL
ncbi:MAG: CDP-glucose 4,6-dehydratase [Clostridia bacterium]